MSLDYDFDLIHEHPYPNIGVRLRRPPGLVIGHGNLLVARLKITSYDQHGTALFPSLGRRTTTRFARHHKKTASTNRLETAAPRAFVTLTLLRRDETPDTEHYEYHSSYRDGHRIPKRWPLCFLGPEVSHPSGDDGEAADTEVENRIPGSRRRPRHRSEKHQWCLHPPAVVIFTYPPPPLPDRTGSPQRKHRGPN